MNSKIKVSNLTVWIREDLNGANITETFVESKSLSKGWNKVTLKNPYKVSDKGFYMGYTYRQTGEAKIIFSLDRPGEKSLMVKEETSTGRMPRISAHSVSKDSWRDAHTRPATVRLFRQRLRSIS